VTEVDRHGEWRLTEDHRLIEVARRHRERPDNRFALVPALRFGNIVPGQKARAFQYE
jgi:hypothetical protein